jgi:hypothetical protein
MTASPDRSVNVWDMASGTVVRKISGENGGLRCVCMEGGWLGLGPYPTVLRCFSHLHLSVRMDRHVQMPDVLPLSPTAAHQGSRMKSMAISGDFSVAAVCLWDSSVAVWELGSGAPRQELQKRGMRSAASGHTSGALLPCWKDE